MAIDLQLYKIACPLLITNIHHFQTFQPPPTPFYAWQENLTD